MTEPALSSNDTPADRADTLGAASVGFAHAIRRSQHAQTDASSCEGEDRLSHLRNSNLQAAATSLADIHPPEYTEDEAAYIRNWFTRELNRFSSLVGDVPALKSGLQELRKRLESLIQGTQGSSVAERQLSDPTEAAPREPSEVETTTAQSPVEVDAGRRVF